MSNRPGQKRTARRLTIGAALLGIVLLLARFAPAQSPQPLYSGNFLEAAPQGFGDRQNSGAWSMTWWNGTLYVGTVRAWFCWSAAWFHIHFPRIFQYPPPDPDLQCAEDPTDLPLQAEIWRWIPGTGIWERVYQSPNDVPIPEHPGKLTARDIGYRAMAVFTEPSGTEALYVGGVTSNLLWPPMPPPRILRSTDGVTFQPIPQDPGTVLGNLGFNQSSFRSMEVYKGRLYVINGQIRGQGRVLEAQDPAGGNDNFRWVTPDGLQVFEMASFNGFLYLGVADLARGYAVVKTDATGTPPYSLTPVVTRGAFARPAPSKSVVSMHVFNGRFYVGTDNPVELIRINPDDSWDLVVGTPRQTPSGWQYPLSGLGTGFNWRPNSHLWRMQDHQGMLYIGTYDESRRVGKLLPALDPVLSWGYGFDLYRTSDGYYVSPITMTGFGDPFQSGIRTFASTPSGLFLGTVSLWYGLRVWQGAPGPALPAPPDRLEAERQPAGVVLSWELPAGATRFHIFRSDFARRPVPIPDSPEPVGIPGPFSEIATTNQLFFVDSTAEAQQQSQYYVVSEDAGGTLSDPSNLVLVPSLAPAVTFTSLTNTLLRWAGPGPLTLELRLARAAAKAGNLNAALARLGRVQQMLSQEPGAVPAWRVEDLQILLAKLIRRGGLAQAGLIPASALL